MQASASSPQHAWKQARCGLLRLVFINPTIGLHLLELRLLLLLRLDPLALDGPEVAAALQAERSDKALDFGSEMDLS